MRRRPLLAAAAAAPWIWPLRASHAGVPDLVIGQFAPLSGPLASRLAAFNAGARLVFDAVNGAGGIRGRRIRWESIDDHGRPEESVAATRSFLQRHQATALFGCVGNDATLASLKLLRQAGVPALAGMEVGDGVRLEGSRIAYFVRAGQGREAEAIARQCAAQKLSGVAILHEPGPAGGELLRLLGDACAARQLRVLGSAAVTGDPGVPQEAARKLAALAPQALLLAVPGRLAGAVLNAAQSVGRQTPAFGLSFVAEDGHILRLGEPGRTLAIAHVMPNPWSEREPALADYRRQASDQRVPVGYASLEGWLSAQVLVEALHRCGRDTSPARLHAVVDALKLSVAGLEVDFSRRELAGSRFVDLVGITPDGHWQR
jgi:ABC-type branched-subunit amino acid transport system substrate-binding protein